MSSPAVALIMTLRNEEAGLRRLLESIDRQTLKPDEVVICDSGSTDATLDSLRRWQEQAPLAVTIIEAPGVNIAGGRNLAIRAAAAGIICVTDGSCVLDEKWVSEITRPLRESGPETGIVFGHSEAVGKSRVGRQFARLHSIKIHSKRNAELERSSRSVAFRKAAWERAGGYPEWMSLAGEDTYFFLQIECFFQSVTAADTRVFWYHGEESLIKIFRKHKRNSLGDGEAHLMPVRYLGLLGIYAGIAIGNAISIFAPVLFLPALACLFIVIFRHTLAALRDRSGVLDALTVMPAITFFRDMGMTAGYTIGLMRRLSKRVPCQSNA